jgi:hypothetical protein
MRICPPPRIGKAGRRKENHDQRREKRPAAAADRQGGRPAKYPWRQMEVGDSFVMPSGSGNAYVAAGAASMRYASNKFIARAVKTGGCRISRVA